MESCIVLLCHIYESVLRAYFLLLLHLLFYSSVYRVKLGAVLLYCERLSMILYYMIIVCLLNVFFDDPLFILEIPSMSLRITSFHGHLSVKFASVSPLNTVCLFVSVYFFL